MAHEPSVNIDGETFTLVSKRPHGGAVYTSPDRSHFLRRGARDEVTRELAAHRHFAALGCPVSLIERQGQDGENGYYIEQSLGDRNFTQRFHRESEATGTAADRTFATYLGLAQQFLERQHHAVSIDPDWVALRRFVHFEKLIDQAPVLTSQLNRAWEQLQHDFAGIDWILAHGDFTSSNVFDRGVTDFETAGPMPYGYDLHVGINSVFWFPLTLDYERSKPYGLSPEQVARYEHQFAQLIEARTGQSYRKRFGAYQVLRGIWLTAASSNTKPKVRAWRETTMAELLDRYLAGQEIHDWWFNRQHGYPARGVPCTYC